MKSIFSICILCFLVATPSFATQKGLEPQCKKIINYEEPMPPELFEEDALIFQTMSEGPRVVLAEHEIIFSSFFKNILEGVYLNRKQLGMDFEFDTAKMIQQLSRQEVDTLAQAMYKEMHDTFILRKKRTSLLKQPVESRNAFYGKNNSYINQETVTDIIGESLIKIGADQKFHDYRALVKSRKAMSDQNASAIFAGSFGSVTFGAMSYLSLSYGVVPVLDLLILPAFVTVFASTAIISVGRHFYKKRTARKTIATELSLLPGPELEYLEEIPRDAVIVQQQPPLAISQAQSSVRLEQISEDVQAIRKELTARGENPKLEIFGEKSISLHEQLIQSFSTGFLAWMVVYDQSHSEIQASIAQLQNNDVEVTERSKNVLNHMEKIFGEASEDTEKIDDLSREILELLERDLKSLQAMENSVREQSNIKQRNWERRVRMLSNSLDVFQEFAQKTDRVHVFISKILDSINGVRLGKSATIINSTGSQLEPGGTQSEALQQLASGLMQFDQYLLEFKDELGAEDGE